MPRNFFRRIEVVFPIEDGKLRDRIINHILAIILADNTKARFLDAKGNYHRPETPEEATPRRSQVEFMDTTYAAKEIDLTLVGGRYPRVTLASRPVQVSDS